MDNILSHLHPLFTLRLFFCFLLFHFIIINYIFSEHFLIYYKIYFIVHGISFHMILCIVNIGPQQLSVSC